MKSEKTRQALVQAFEQLAKEKPFSQITVGEIVEKCGLTRGAFYYHFETKQALFDWVYKQDHKALAPSIEIDKMRSIWKQLAKRLAENPESYRVNMLSNLYEPLHNEWFKGALRDWTLIFDTHLGHRADQVDATCKELLALYMVYGYLGVLREMAESDQGWSEDRLFHMMQLRLGILEKGVYGTLDSLAAKSNDADAD